MLTTAHSFFRLLSKPQLILFTVCLVAFVSVLDYATGYELTFALFYMIPVFIGTWYGRAPIGVLACITAGLAWLAVDLSAAYHYSHSAIVYWNAAVRLSTFSVLAYLLEYLHRSLETQAMLAERDGLTGLINARTFKLSCDAAFELAARHDRSLALGYLDLDDFKTVNDTLGHSVGDTVLQAVAGTLAKRLRASDLGARLGGDEFAILLPETDLIGAQIFFSELHKNLVELSVQSSWPIGFSIGVAVFRHPPSNADEAILCADKLMYRVKRGGKNSIFIEDAVLS